ncbi:gamma-glutamyltransferase [Prosthecomicrobium sp. N25]|uniref:gamma-glutamyltransferase n=1 Tax=Prosthecomicrobium sp. N25 TaxID=3129254 RepID=UPI003077D2DA
MRNFHLPGRSPVHALNGMAATSHPLASLAAVDCLRQGGNAVDAAVTASAVLAVVEPHMTGIGGDCFAIVALPDGTLQGLNGSGRSAAAATTDFFLERGITEIADGSVHAVTVPGAVAAWHRLLSDFGTWGLDRCLQPAIAHAADGFAVAQRVGSDWARLEAKLAADPGSARHYLPGGRAPQVGDVVALPALARTLRAIAAGGPEAFYTGAVAEDIVATVRARGGLLSLDDLAGVDPLAVKPVTAAYRDLEVAELPPNGQGITALILLNILKRFDLAGLDPTGAERFHLEIEAARLAYACRDAFIADPAAMTVSVEALVSDGYGAALADRIDRHRRLADVTPETIPDADTIYLTVVDRDRMAVSFINSIYDPFGVGLCTEATGILLQNRGACFRVDPAHPNTIGPRKRPMHTIIPGFALRKGRPLMPFGVMGGAYQACGHAHVISNMVDFGMDVQAAIDAPRAFWGDETDAVLVEAGVPEATRAGLRERGHAVAARAEPFGGGQAILIDWERGVLVGGSDPRKDGLAIGY